MTPIIEQIALKLETLVNAITVANGYNYDLLAVRPKRLFLEGDLYDDLNVVIEQAECKLMEESDEILIWSQEFSLQAICIDSDTATESIDTKRNKIRSDIEKKLMTDENWLLDGLAEGIIFAGAEPFYLENKIYGISVNINVIYKVNTNDPYSQNN